MKITTKTLILKTTKAVIVSVIMAIVAGATAFSVTAHNLIPWGAWYDRHNAISNSSYRFAMLGSQYTHMNGSSMRYLWGSTLAKTNFSAALTPAFGFFGNMISGTEATNNSQAHIRISYTVLTNDLGADALAFPFGGDSDSHFRQGPQSGLSHGRLYDGEIVFYANAINMTAQEKIQTMAHELGHLWGIADLYDHCKWRLEYFDIPINPNCLCHSSTALDSAFSKKLWSLTSATRHDRNALRIGLNDPWFNNGGATSTNPTVNNGWKRLKSANPIGNFAQNEWLTIGGSDRFFNSSGYWVTSPSFTITFDQNYIGKPANTTAQTGTGTTTGGKLTSSQIPAPTRPGHNFIGWFDTSATTGGTRLTTGTTHVAGRTYWARWTPITITFNAGSGTVSPTTATVNTNNKLTSLPIPTWGNAQFVGWFAPGNNTMVTTDTVFTQNTIIFASWSASTAANFTHRIEPNNQITITGLVNPQFNGSVSIPSSIAGLPVTRIENEAFRNARITDVTIPNTVVTIGNRAFQDCERLAALTFQAASKVETIGSYAFLRNSIASVTIPNSVITIRDGAFQDCANLRTLTFQPTSKVEIIWSAAFLGTSLTSVTVPDSVYSIQASAFSTLTAMTSITIGSGVTSIRESPFHGASNLVMRFRSLTPPDFNAWSLNGLQNSTRIEVPTASLAIYSAVPLLQRFNIVGY